MGLGLAFLAKAFPMQAGLKRYYGHDHPPLGRLSALPRV